MLCQNILHTNSPCTDRKCRMEHNIAKYFGRKGQTFKYIAVEKPVAFFCSVKHVHRQMSQLFSHGMLGKDLQWIQSMQGDTSKAISELGFHIVKDEEATFEIFSNYSINHNN